jgi:ribosome-binding protein aMBF1 (putative translation factor)
MNTNEQSLAEEITEGFKALETIRKLQDEVEALKKLIPRKRTRQRNEEDAMFLGAVCRGSRAWLGWTQKKLAGKIGKGLSVIIKIEQNRGNPQLDTYNKLMSTFEENGVKILKHDKTITLKMQRLAEK